MINLGVLTISFVLTFSPIKDYRLMQNYFIDLPKHEVVEIVEETQPEETQAIQEWYNGIPLSKSVQEHIEKLCKQYGVSKALVYAVIEKESSFHNTSVSATNDYGLMQINKGNHEVWCKRLNREIDWFNPYDNTEVGIRMLASYGCKDIRQTIMCYSMGVGRANKLWESGTHTTNYVEDILIKMEKYK